MTSTPATPPDMKFRLSLLTHFLDQGYQLPDALHAAQCYYRTLISMLLYRNPDMARPY